MTFSNGILFMFKPVISKFLVNGMILNRVKIESSTAKVYTYVVLLH